MRDKQVRRSVPEVLAQRAADQPGKLLVSCGGADRTYGEMAEIAEQGAAGLAALGVAPGDRVAMLTANRIELIELFFACARLGAVQVPINTFLKGEFLRYQLADCGAETIVVDGPGLAAIAPLLDRLPAVRRIITLDDPDAGEFVRYRELARGGNAGDLAVPRPDDLASI